LKLQTAAKRHYNIILIIKTKVKTSSYDFHRKASLFILECKELMHGQNFFLLFLQVFKSSVKLDYDRLLSRGVSDFPSVDHASVYSR